MRTSDRRGIEMLRLAGHDVMTVRDQNLQGIIDETLFDVCAGEDRVLITLDHDFGQVLRFPPERGAGLVNLEPGRSRCWVGGGISWLWRRYDRR
jgi:hypothetical protein